tara:strand:+ start:6128 stop:6877 length:750 start_codon:yes stop_codon:yes gene_type:complete
MSDKFLKYYFKIPFLIGVTSYIRFLYFFYFKKKFKTLYPINSSDHGMAKKNDKTALMANTEHLGIVNLNFLKMISQKFNGARSSRLIYPLKSIDYLKFEKQKILSIGPRLESEIFNFIKHGFLLKNIKSIDLQSYSPIINLGDMLKLEYEDDFFDIVFCGWVLTYTNSIQKAVDEMVRVTKNNGYISIGISHKPDVKLTDNSVANSNDLLNYFNKNIKRVIFNHHAGDVDDYYNKMKNFRCVLVIQVKK